MFGTFEYTTLQQYWWIIISLLAGFLVFLMFVQGGQTLIFSLGRSEQEKKILINALGRKWEFTFTTLVTFGGAFFASFPLFYSTSFGGAYWLWICILFSFIIQAIAYEFRSKPNNFLGKGTYEIFLLLNGIFGTLLIGVAVGTFFSGANFSVDFKNLLHPTSPVISRWTHPALGLEAIIQVPNLLLGLSVLFLARLLALQYFIKNVDHEKISTRLRNQLLINSIPFLLFFLSFAIWLLLKSGIAYQDNGVMLQESFKYLHNLIEMPLVGLLFLLGVVLVLTGLVKGFLQLAPSSIYFSGSGTILVVVSLFCIAGLNGTAYYPSLTNIQQSLTIENSSSSKYTLTVMSYVSLLVPFVLAYIFIAWKSINKEKVSENELSTEPHTY